MTREQYGAMRARLAEISYYEPAVIDEIAEQALEGVEGLLARVDALEAENAALRARAVPSLEWEPASVGGHSGVTLLARSGLFQFSAFADGQWAIFLGHNIEMKGYGGGKLACEAAFLRLVGVKS